MQFTNFGEDIVPFGKWKGWKIDEVSDEYLVWAYNNLPEDHYYMPNIKAEVTRRQIDVCEWDQDEDDGSWRT